MDNEYKVNNDFRQAFGEKFGFIDAKLSEREMFIEQWFCTQHKPIPEDVKGFIENKAKERYPYIPSKNKDGEDFTTPVGQKNPHNWNKHLKEQSTFTAGFNLCHETYVYPLKEQVRVLREAMGNIENACSDDSPLLDIIGKIESIASNALKQQ